MKTFVSVSIALLITLCFTTETWARPHRHPRPVPVHSGDHLLSVSLAETYILLAMLLTTEAIEHPVEKAAIRNAQVGALNVLNGEEATDLFINGRQALENLQDADFSSDFDAAIAIIQMNELMDQAE